MQEVLGSYQLASPEEYVLAVLSAAVLQGAGHFQLEYRDGASQLSWDGPPLALEDFHQILPRLGRADCPLAELAVALLAARRLGQAQLLSPHGRVFFRGSHLEVDEKGEPGRNRLVLRRHWWQRLLRKDRQSERMLRQRGRFAPLQVTPQPPTPVITVSLALSFGTVQYDWLKAEEWVEFPEGPWGRGVVYFGNAPWRVVRHGVSYEMSAPFQGVVAVWWSDSLPLDLSRKELRKGPEREGWLKWLLEQLADFVLQRNLTEKLGFLVRSSHHLQGVAFLEAPLFRCADGSMANLLQIRRDYQEHGWLPVVSHPMFIEWEPWRVLVVEQPHEKQLCEAFRNWLNLDHLEGVHDIPRLPAEEEYLVRVPFFRGKGEAGLRRYPSYHGFREWVEGEWQGKRGSPHGLDAAKASSQDAIPVGELYWTLHLRELPDTFEYLRKYHLVAMLVWLKLILNKNFSKQYSRRHPLMVLLDPASQVQVDHCRGKIRTQQLRTLVDRITLRLHSGHEIPLESLGLKGGERRISLACVHAPQDHLAETFSTAILLQHLFLPGAVAESTGLTKGILPVTRVAQVLLAGLSCPDQFLRRLTEYKQCSAYQILKAAGLLGEVERRASASPFHQDQQGVKRLLERAEKEPRIPASPVNTAYLLLALADDPSVGLSREAVLPHLLEWAEYENREELEEKVSIFHQHPELLANCTIRLAYSYIASRNFEKARQLVQPFCHGPHRAMGFGVLALSYALDGQLEVALGHSREAAKWAKEVYYKTTIAEKLLYLGRLEEAREACPDDDDEYTLLIRASLCQNPDQCLELCERAEKAGPGQYFELAEARGQAFAKLGRNREARECLLRFLEARLDNSTLYLFEERMAAARSLLASLDDAGQA